MKIFKDYEPKRETPTKDEVKAEELQGFEELTKRVTDAYTGKSSGETLQSILAQAEQSKRAGTLTNEEIDLFYEQFSPMLNSFQRKQLNAIVKRLKEL